LDAKTAAKITNERGRHGINPGENSDPRVDSEDTKPHVDEAKVGEGRSEDVSDLIFVVHGIGQGVRALMATVPICELISRAVINSIRIVQLRVHGEPDAHCCAVSFDTLPISMLTCSQKASDDTRLKFDHAIT
jgi:hypothetical protein